MKFLFAGLSWLALATAGSAFAQAQAEPPAPAPQLRQAQTLIEDNKPEQAYALLAPLESELAGEPEYDYLLGVSALNSGKPSLAVFAFERVEATDPQYRNIGLWLAIAYYRSGNLERAKPAFEAVVQQSSDAETRRKAQAYLDNLQRAEAENKNRPALLGKLDLGIGYDSNITNSSLSSFTATQLASALPAPSSNRGAMETIANLAVEGRVPISRHYAFLSAEDQKRDYLGKEFMSSDMLTTRGGMNFENSAGDTYRLSVWQRNFRQQGTLFAINGISNDYDIGGGEANARLKLSPQSYVGYVFQYNQIRFRTNSPDNTDQGMASMNFTHVFQSRGSPVVYLGYALLYNQAVQSKASYNPAYGDGTTVASRATQFISGYFQYSVRSDVDIVSTDYVYFRRDIGAFARDASVAYGRDRTTYLSLGVNWRFEPKWSLRGLLARTANRSNIAIYSYNKTEGLVLLRRDFN
jgi:tetratricopeptide (TPR) repeat protein